MMRGAIMWALLALALTLAPASEAVVPSRAPGESVDSHGVIRRPTQSTAPQRRIAPPDAEAPTEIAPEPTEVSAQDLTQDAEVAVDDAAGIDWRVWWIAIALFFVLSGLLIARFAWERLPAARSVALGTRPNYVAAAAKVALVLAPIGGVALLAAQQRESHPVLASASLSGEARLIEVSPDGGYFAFAGSDGAVQVFDAKAPIRPLTTIRTGANGSAVALAILRVSDFRLRVGVASLYGPAQIFDVRFSADGAATASLATDTGLISAGAPARIGLSGDDGWVVAIEDGAGAMRLVTQRGETGLPVGGPVTAIASVGPDSYVIGALDGRLRELKLSGEQVALNVLRGATPEQPYRLRGAVRTLLTTPEAVTAIGVDGATLTVAIEDGALGHVEAGPVLSHFRLAVALPWRTAVQAPQAAQAPPPPQAPVGAPVDVSTRSPGPTSTATSSAPGPSQDAIDEMLLRARPGPESRRPGVLSPDPLILAVYGYYELRYSVTARGIEAGTYELAFRVENGGYSATAARRTIGVTRSVLGDGQDYSYRAAGRLTAARQVAPATYSHEGGRRGRVVNVEFRADDVVTTANPVMGMGNPPATQQQRMGTVDNLSMFLDMMVRPGEPCAQTYRVFMDGRARFDLALTPNGVVRANTRAWRGTAQRCRAEYRPIAGFADPQQQTMMTFTFGRQGEVWLPLSIEMPTEDQGVIQLSLQRFAISAVSE